MFRNNAERESRAIEGGKKRGEFKIGWSVCERGERKNPERGFREGMGDTHVC